MTYRSPYIFLLIFFLMSVMQAQATTDTSSTRTQKVVSETEELRTEKLYPKLATVIYQKSWAYQKCVLSLRQKTSYFSSERLDHTYDHVKEIHENVYRLLISITRILDRPGWRIGLSYIDYYALGSVLRVAPIYSNAFVNLENQTRDLKTSLDNLLLYWGVPENNAIFHKTSLSMREVSKAAEEQAREASIFEKEVGSTMTTSVDIQLAQELAAILSQKSDLGFSMGSWKGVRFQKCKTKYSDPLERSIGCIQQQLSLGLYGAIRKERLKGRYTQYECIREDESLLTYSEMYRDKMEK